LILSYEDLKLALKKGQIKFSPNISEDQIGISSIDLRLGYVFTRLKENPGLVVRPAADGFNPTDIVEHENLENKSVLGEQARFKLHPGELKLALTLEEVTVPGSLAANVQGKSSLARSGLAVHITAPHIHPGFVGRITLELYNHGPWELEFVPGKDLICQIIFFKVTKRVPDQLIKSLGTYMKQLTPYPERMPGRRDRSRTKSAPTAGQARSSQPLSKAGTPKREPPTDPLKALVGRKQYPRHIPVEELEQMSEEE
jgi:dCTP deaminase